MNGACGNASFLTKSEHADAACPLGIPQPGQKKLGAEAWTRPIRSRRPKGGGGKNTEPHHSSHGEATNPCQQGDQPRDGAVYGVQHQVRPAVVWRFSGGPLRSMPLGSPLHERMYGDLWQKPSGSKESSDVHGRPVMLLANGAVGQRSDFRLELLEACIQANCGHTDYPVFPTSPHHLSARNFRVQLV